MRYWDAGITADQLVKYLKTHAHPRMVPSVGTPWSPLPRAVTDQLFLWQVETRRIKVKAARLYSEFSDDRDFEETLEFCRETGALLSVNLRAKRMAVTELGHIEVKRWRNSR
jgi:transcription initiation factor TFIIH subunit 4